MILIEFDKRFDLRRKFSVRRTTLVDKQYTQIRYVFDYVKNVENEFNVI